jgi:hypothetical protein
LERGPGSAWQSGVVLRLEDCRVLVRSVPERNRVFCTILGERSAARRALACVRTTIESINSAMRLREAKELVCVIADPATTERGDRGDSRTDPWDAIGTKPRRDLEDLLKDPEAGRSHRLKIGGRWHTVGELIEGIRPPRHSSPRGKIEDLDEEDVTSRGRHFPVSIQVGDQSPVTVSVVGLSAGRAAVQQHVETGSAQMADTLPPKPHVLTLTLAGVLAIGAIVGSLAVAWRNVNDRWVFGIIAIVLVLLVVLAFTFITVMSGAIAGTAFERLCVAVLEKLPLISNLVRFLPQKARSKK